MNATSERADADSRRIRLLLAAWAIVVLALALIAVALTGTHKSWKAQLTVNGVPGTKPGDYFDGFATANSFGDRVCVAVPEVPAESRYAEFFIGRTVDIRARVLVRHRLSNGLVSSLHGRIVKTRIPGTNPYYQGGIVRLPLPAGAASAASGRVCIQSKQKSLFDVRGSSEFPLLRLVSGERQTRLSQLASMLDRVGAAKGQPFRAIGGWGALALALAAFVLAVATAYRAWVSDGASIRKRTVLLVAIVAVFHAWAWACLVPPLQVPDEPDHAVVANLIGATGRLASARDGSYQSDRGDIALAKSNDGTPLYPESFSSAMQMLRDAAVRFNPGRRPPWTKSESDAVLREFSKDPRANPDVLTNATNQPPLYYASVAPASWGGGSLLEAVARMRVLGALWFGLAAAAAALLVRELFPARSALAVTGGLLVALFPMLAFMSGGVNPDGSMTAMTLVVFAVGARIWRRGLTRRRAAAFGVLLGCMMLTKLTALAVVPGALIFLIGAAIRARRRDPRKLKGLNLGVMAGSAILPLAIYAVWAKLSGRSILPGVVGQLALPDGPTSAAPTGMSGSPMEFLSSFWQMFLPRLGFMTDAYPPPQTDNPLWNIWIRGIAGIYGYLDYGMPTYVSWILTGTAVVLLLIGVFAIAAAIRRSTLKRVLLEHAVPAAALLIGAVGLLAVIARVDYSARLHGGPVFTQARYLFPMAPLVVAIVAVALRGLPRWLAPVAAIGLIGLAVAWSAGSLALTLVRYYG